MPEKGFDRYGIKWHLYRNLAKPLCSLRKILVANFEQ
jgi:hypothetical protein